MPAAKHPEHLPINEQDRKKKTSHQNPSDLPPPFLPPPLPAPAIATTPPIPASPQQYLQAPSNLALPAQKKSLEIRTSPCHPAYVRPPPMHVTPHASHPLMQLPRSNGPPRRVPSAKRTLQCTAPPDARARGGAGRGMPGAARRGDGLDQTRVGPRAAALAGRQGRWRTCGAGAFCWGGSNAG